MIEPIRTSGLPDLLRAQSYDLVNWLNNEPPLTKQSVIPAKAGILRTYQRIQMVAALAPGLRRGDTTGRKCLNHTTGKFSRATAKTACT